MRIAFIMKERQVAEPLGPMLLSSLLKAEGHEVRLFFASDRDWLRNIASFSPRLLAYSVISGSHNAYLGINRLARKATGDFSIFGGPHTTFFPETVHADGVDAVCIGEGELAILELARRMEEGSGISKIQNLWVRDQESIHQNPVRPLIQNLDELPFPDRALVYGEDRYLRESKIKRFLGVRGCPFQCTYCFNRSFNEIYKGQRIIRWRSVRNLIDEISAVKSAYPLELVRFVDDIFILPPMEWLEHFAEVYRRTVNLPFVCNLRVNIVSEEKVRLLKRAGCVAVYMAIEAGNDRLRNTVLQRKMSRKEIIDAFDLVHRYGISLAAENILGLPGGSLKTDLETLELNMRCRVDNPVSTLFQPYPKTVLGEYALKEGYFDGNPDKVEESYFGKSRMVFSSSREKRQIENLHRFFGFAATHPRMLFLIRPFLRLPGNRLFDLFHRMWDSYCKMRRIFPVKLTLKDRLMALQRVLRY